MNILDLVVGKPIKTTDERAEQIGPTQGIPILVSMRLARLVPGTYRIEVEKPGFKKLIRADVILHVQDALDIDFEMPVGAASESVTVEGGAPLLNTESASVSTLIDNRFVENMPLNGRSFSSLIDLTPGVVLVPSNFFEEGQFSVSGQRPDANYFMVDGVSANLGTPDSSFGQGGTGQLPATNALGGFSNLASLDALQEFRIQTSTFAPEFGRTPGAQVSVVTKSGTNAFHGTAFEYLRNHVFDANDWFADNKGLKEPALRQNDFGGVLGGPVIKDKLFFFGRRLAHTAAADCEYVRANTGDAPECARGCPAAAECVPSTDWRQLPRLLRWYCRICRWIL
jgi:hypothetical protein